jgi:hypothetical protein
MALLPRQRHHHRGGEVQHQHMCFTRPLQLPAVGLTGMVRGLACLEQWQLIRTDKPVDVCHSTASAYAI